MLMRLCGNGQESVEIKQLEEQLKKEMIAEGFQFPPDVEEEEEESFNSLNIFPGTDFMSELQVFLDYYVTKTLQSNEKLQNLYIFQRDTAKAYLTVFAKEKLEKKNPKEEVLIELFKAQNEIQLNAVKDEVTRHKNRLTILLITTVSAALILILIILFLLVKRTYDIKRREVEMDNKAKIAELKKIQQYKEDRIMKETADKLSLLESQVKDSDVKDKINVIRNELKGAKDDNEWKEFARYIPEFNGPFYKNLTKAFPNLSINESRMCVLLNRNLSTKQISAITGQKPESINIARTRLRKKLGIAGNPISIQEFLRRYDM